MCTQYYRIYSCGCKKLEQFVQCEVRRNTNEKCLKHDIDNEPQARSQHECKNHLLKPGHDKKVRENVPQNGAQNGGACNA